VSTLLALACEGGEDVVKATMRIWSSPCVHERVVLIIGSRWPADSVTVFMRCVDGGTRRFLQCGCQKLAVKGGLGSPLTHLVGLPQHGSPLRFLPPRPYTCPKAIDIEGHTSNGGRGQGGNLFEYRGAQKEQNRLAISIHMVVIIINELLAF